MLHVGSFIGTSFQRTIACSNLFGKENYENIESNFVEIACIYKSKGLYSRQLMSSNHPVRRSNSMRFGHVTGTKKERSSKSPNWYYQTKEAQEILRKLEEEERTKKSVTQ
jgi:hypothetical protein